MELVQNRDQDAFSTLVRRHTDRFYALAYRTLFNRMEAEDIVQESFLKLWSKPYLWESNRKVRFVTWFYRIIINACYDHNKRKSSNDHASSDFAEIEAGSCSLEAHRLESEVEKALLSLPDKQRIAIALCFYEGLSNREAAEALGVKLKALQSLLMRGKSTLKMKLGISEVGNNE